MKGVMCNEYEVVTLYSGLFRRGFVIGVPENILFGVLYIYNGLIGLDVVSDNKEYYIYIRNSICTYIEVYIMCICVSGCRNIHQGVWSNHCCCCCYYHHRCLIEMSICLHGIGNIHSSFHCCILSLGISTLLL